MPTPNINREVKKAVEALTHLQRRTLPVKVGNEAVNMFKDNFDDGGFFGRKWEEPVRRKLSFNGARGKNDPLLSGNDHLKNSIKKEFDDNQPGKVYIKNKVDYAIYHNEGTTITVTKKMKRYFMYRFLLIAGSKGNERYSPIPSQFKRTKGGKLSKNQRNQALSREARFYLAMAHKKEGSTIRIPKRQFMGNHPVLAKKINDIIYNELKKFIDTYGRNLGTAR